VEADYLLALITGLFSGFGHCIGMCGPLVASYALAAAPDNTRTFIGSLAPHALYNMGRITTYALIGGSLGLSGSYVNLAGRLAGVQNIVALLAGVLMIFMGLGIAGSFRGLTAWIELRNIPFLRAAQRVRQSSSALRYYPLGLVLGFLPCGLSYTIFIASAGMGGLFSGMLMALAFGLGTLPALLLFGTVMTAFSARFRVGLHRAGGFIVIIMGFYFLFRGITHHAHM